MRKALLTPKQVLFSSWVLDPEDFAGLYSLWSVGKLGLQVKSYVDKRAQAAALKRELYEHLKVIAPLVQWKMKVFVSG